MLFKVSLLEVITKLDVEVVPKTVGPSVLSPYEGVFAFTGHANYSVYIHICLTSRHIQILWQLHIECMIFYFSLSISKPKSK